uniref:Carbamoyl-phosphate synthase (glutamine-hydrolyzing) n=1 Tax=Parastrongyloides trichosuri TaxID=131310 RepID=A0A0N5A0R0_PARTI
LPQLDRPADRDHRRPDPRDREAGAEPAAAEWRPADADRAADLASVADRSPDRRGGGARPRPERPRRRPRAGRRAHRTEAGEGRAGRPLRRFHGLGLDPVDAGAVRISVRGHLSPAPRRRRPEQGLRCSGLRLGHDPGRPLRRRPARTAGAGQHSRRVSRLAGPHHRREDGASDRRLRAGGRQRRHHRLGPPTGRRHGGAGAGRSEGRRRQARGFDRLLHPGRGDADRGRQQPSADLWGAVADERLLQPKCGLPSCGRRGVDGALSATGRGLQRLGDRGGQTVGRRRGAGPGARRRPRDRSGSRRGEPSAGSGFLAPAVQRSVLRTGRWPTDTGSPRWRSDRPPRPSACGSRAAGPAGAAQDQHAQGHGAEGHQSAGVGQGDDFVQREEQGDGPHHAGGEHGDAHRGAALGHAGQAARQQAVARHDEEDAALTVEEGQDHGRQGQHRRDGQEVGGAGLADLAQDQGQRLGAVGEQGEGRGAQGGRGDDGVDGGADQHGADDADGQIALGIAGLLGRRGDGVEAVEGKEDDRRRRHHAVLDAVRAHRLGKAIGHERLQVVAVEGGKGQPDEQGQGRQLHHHQDQVERGAFLGARQQKGADGDDDGQGGDVGDSARMRPLHQSHRQAQPVTQQGRRIARPTDGHGADHQAVFQDQAPADDPSRHLAQHYPRIGVGAARSRHHRRHFGVGQRGAGADEARDQEGQQDGRAGLVRADADQGQDAGADDGAHAHRHQVRPAEVARQARGAGLCAKA